MSMENRNGDVSSFRDCLPSGLQLGEKLGTGESHFGVVFEVRDHRLGDHRVVRRTVRFLPGSLNERWRTEFNRRVSELSSLDCAHISRPLAWGTSPDGQHLYLLCDRYAATLGSQIPASGIHPKIAWEILNQLASGLAVLHQRGLPHGDLRPENIFLSSLPLSRYSSFYLGDTWLGSMPSDSGGMCVGSSASSYLPPEWEGKVKPPSTSADIFALGRIICKVMLGTQGLPTSSLHSAWRRQTLLALKRKGIGFFQRQIINGMLGENSDRYANGRALQDALARSERSLLYAGLGVMALCFIIFAAIAIASNRSMGLLKAANFESSASIHRITRENATLTEKLNDKQSEVLKTTSDLASSQRRVDVLQKSEQQLVAIRGLLAEQASAAPQFTLKKITEVVGAPLSKTQQQARSAWSVIKDLAESERTAAIEKQAEPLVKAALREWIADTMIATRDIAALGRPPELISAIRAFREEPYDPLHRNALALVVWRQGIQKAQRPPQDSFESTSRVITTLDAQGWLRKVLMRWRQHLANHNVQWHPWLKPQYSGLYQPWEKLLTSPGDETLQQESEATVVALREAARIWEEKSDTAPNWERFRSDSIDAAKDNSRVLAVLQRWRDEFTSKRNWKLKLVSGTTDHASGKWREVLLRVGGVPQSEYKANWEDESVDFPDDAICEFTWNPGEHIELVVDGERTWRSGYYRRNLISDEPYTSPVAPWTMNWFAARGPRKSANGAHSLSFRILDCPGPPPDYKGNLNLSP